MKHSITLLSALTLSIFGCQTDATQEEKTTPEVTEKDSVEGEPEVPRVDQQEFQAILDSVGVKGSIVLYDLNKNRFYSNNFDWAGVGRLPASTFKIANSIIGLETGVIKPDTVQFKWNGKPRRLNAWNRDMDLHDAYHFSCLPCYQEVAREVGYKRYHEYLKKLDYGQMVVDSTSVDVFWVEGESKINQFEQIDFLKRLYQRKLPISDSTYKVMRELMILDEGEDYVLRGKTGWSIRDGNNYGWFVGYVEKGEDVWFFATSIHPNQDFNMNLFPVIRKEITVKALEQLGVLSAKIE